MASIHVNATNVSVTSNATYQKILFDTVSTYSKTSGQTISSGGIAVPITGVYAVSCNWGGSGITGVTDTAIYVNSTSRARGTGAQHVATTLYLTAADVVYVYVKTSSNNTITFTNGLEQTWLTVAMIA